MGSNQNGAATIRTDRQPARVQGVRSNRTHPHAIRLAACLVSEQSSLLRLLKSLHEVIRGKEHCRKLWTMTGPPAKSLVKIFCRSPTALAAVPQGSSQRGRACGGGLLPTLGCRRFFPATFVQVLGANVFGGRHLLIGWHSAVCGLPFAANQAG